MAGSKSAGKSHSKSRSKSKSGSKLGKKSDSRSRPNSRSKSSTKRSSKSQSSKKSKDSKSKLPLIFAIPEAEHPVQVEPINPNQPCPTSCPNQTAKRATPDRSQTPLPSQVVQTAQGEQATPPVRSAPTTCAPGKSCTSRERSNQQTNQPPSQPEPPNAQPAEIHQSSPRACPDSTSDRFLGRPIQPMQTDRPPTDLLSPERSAPTCVFRDISSKVPVGHGPSQGSVPPSGGKGAPCEPCPMDSQRAAVLKDEYRWESGPCVRPLPSSPSPDDGSVAQDPLFFGRHLLSTKPLPAATPPPVLYGVVGPPGAFNPLDREVLAVSPDPCRRRMPLAAPGDSSADERPFGAPRMLSMWQQGAPPCPATTSEPGGFSQSAWDAFISGVPDLSRSFF